MKGKMEELQDAGEDKAEELKEQAENLMNNVEISWNSLLEKLKA